MSHVLGDKQSVTQAIRSVLPRMVRIGYLH